MWAIVTDGQAVWYDIRCNAADMLVESAMKAVVLFTLEDAGVCDDDDHEIWRHLP